MLCLCLSFSLILVLHDLAVWLPSSVRNFVRHCHAWAETSYNTGQNTENAFAALLNATNSIENNYAFIRVPPHVHAEEVLPKTTSCPHIWPALRSPSQSGAIKHTQPAPVYEASADSPCWISSSASFVSKASFPPPPLSPKTSAYWELPLYPVWKLMTKPDTISTPPVSSGSYPFGK